MSSKRELSVGSLRTWLSSCNVSSEFVDVLHDRVTAAEVRERLTLIETARFEAYQQLLCELHADGFSAVNQTAVTLVLEDSRELVVCLWSGSTLIATAQASLLFPGMRPTVHISNVIVASPYRRQGHGEFLLRYLKQRTTSCWGRSQSLRYELTSQAKRGTKEFYLKLGYVGTPTIRYVR